MFRNTENKLRAANTKLINAVDRMKGDLPINVWFVGGSWGTENKAPDFLIDGLWELGWTIAQQPGMYKDLSNMKSGDIIVLKKNAGSQIEVLSVGVVMTVFGNIPVPLVRDGNVLHDETHTHWVNTVHWFDGPRFKMHSFGMYSACNWLAYNQGNSQAPGVVENMFKALRLI